MKNLMLTLGVLFFAFTSKSQWTALTPLASGEWLTALYFVDNNTGFAVGENGKIIKTTNGGLTWVSQNSGTSNGLASVFFTDATHGYAVGGASTLTKTADGGNTWTVTSFTSPFNLVDVFFPSTNTGYFVETHSQIIETVDG